MKEVAKKIYIDLLNSKCNVEYLCCDSVLKFIDDSDGQTFIIKNHITESDMDFIKQHTNIGMIVTTSSSTLTEDNIHSSLRRQGYNIAIQDSIPLDYLYSNKTLYISGSTPQDDSIPNIVKLWPVEADIVIKLIPINIESADIYTNSVTCSTLTSTFAAQHDEQAIVPHSLSHRQQLILDELVKHFNANYVCVKTTLHSGDIARHRIPLTKFYKTAGIANGRLKGSFDLLPKNDSIKISDSYILSRAITEIDNRYAVNIGKGYGKIIKRTDREKYEQAQNSAVDDFRKYLTGAKRRGDMVGNIQISHDFPVDTIRAQINELGLYLINIAPQPIRSHDDPYVKMVDNFLKTYLDEIDFWAAAVKIERNYSIWDTQNWYNKDFLSAIIKAYHDTMFTIHKGCFFDDNYLYLLEEYMDSISPR